MSVNQSGNTQQNRELLGHFSMVSVARQENGLLCNEQPAMDKCCPILAALWFNG